MKKIVLLPLLLLLLVSFKADEGNGIEAGEKLVYAGSYNMSGLMTHIAQVTMSTENVNTSKNQYLHLSCELATFSKWDKFFKIRDLYESYVTPGSLKPNLYKRSIDEGGYTKKEKYVFKGNQVTSTVQKRKRPETTRTFTIGANSVDAITLLYKLRSVDFSKMKSGQTKSFTIVFDEKEIPVTLKFMGTETITAGNLGAKSCYKLSIGAKTNALRGKDKNLIWLTADAHKVPALMKFSIPVGTGELKLTSATGL
ncbi:DUF3108 domain-containing protein [Flavobacterium sp.]|jgi:hypothetical protein|uniref:DUF3108 domain-containing protein n=1 Tax=Flavobacterium sp. TaxID=239 RepID=UPI0022C7E26B|nr:DUF3108 domain-containing protein [Flavobacterium sp.]MCZ8144758.1 DUF3108 domain-containing protein [Flavobacterium sp.]MCZ8367113.1 DUF3108 domain-containing protein [Flavobacterium sp.]